MHFNNYIFFCNESNYAQLKIELKLFIKNFITIIKKTNRRCNRIKKNYINKIKNVKQRLNYKLKKSLYRDFIIYIILIVLRIINTYYTRLLKIQQKNINLLICTKSF